MPRKPRDALIRNSRQTRQERLNGETKIEEVSDDVKSMNGLDEAWSDYQDYLAKEKKGTDEP